MGCNSGPVLSSDAFPVLMAFRANRALTVVRATARSRYQRDQQAVSGG